MPTFLSLSTSSQAEEQEKTQKLFPAIQIQAMASKSKTFWEKKLSGPSIASKESPSQEKKKKKVMLLIFSYYLDVLTLTGTSLENLSLTCALIH
jgi:hypothetical protein